MPLFRGRMLARFAAALACEGPPLLKLFKTFMLPHSVSSVVVLARRSASARSSAARCRAFISRNDARCSRLETRPRLRVTPPRAICSADALALVSDVGGNGPPFLIKSLYKFINSVKYSVVHSTRKNSPESVRSRFTRPAPAACRVRRARLIRRRAAALFNY